MSCEIDLAKAPRKIFRTLHTSITEEVEPVEEFNRGIKRGDTILVTGDRPRFALMRTFPEDKSDPDLIKLGDCRIGIEYEGVFEWIDQSEDIRTIFRPSCTEYRIALKQVAGLEIALTVSQAEDWGAVAKLSLRNLNHDVLKLAVKLVYGGISRHGRTFTASYFDIDKDYTSGNEVEIKDGFAFLSDSDIPERICVRGVPAVKPEKKRSKVSFDYEILLGNGGTRTFCLIAGRIQSYTGVGTDLSQVDPDVLIHEAAEYYAKLLSGISVSTPSKLLDSGLMTAILNLEYDYTGKLWLEGVHWWSSFWPINYQISAAISLGQLYRAKKALDFLGSLECGPCPALMASEKPYLNHIGVYNYGIEEGLPYYIYQLIQYYRHTGDKELVQKVWDKLCASILYLFDVRDGSRSGLLDWHLGCNGFLYQADHLAMPGDAASPSIMVSGLLEKLSGIAAEIGRTEDAANWKQISENMKKKLISHMWNGEEGFFYNHIDYQNIKHSSHYYTDLVFPVLYSSLPEEIKLRSLKSLYSKLLYETDDGRLLMRVGDFKPSIFGNDNVMPVQICETSRGMFEIGDNETGLRLLESVALAGTIYTEAPGNFPERMDDDGKGEANYIFGNSIGSYICSIISGLFGISLENFGQTLKCSPAFPYEWDNADLRLPYSSISYRKSVEGNKVKAVYKICSVPARKLEFSTLLNSESIFDINCINIAGEKKVIAEYGKKKVVFVSSSISDCFEIEIKYAVPNSLPERRLKKHSKNTSLSASMKLLGTFDKKRFQTLDIKSYCNSEIIRAISAWRNEDLYINLSKYEKFNGVVEIEGIPFDVVKREESGDKSVKMVLLEHSKSHPYTGTTIISDNPHSIKISLEKKVNALALLYASECQSRQTGVDVGEIRLNYENGTAGKITLNVGKNMDTLFSHFADDTIPVGISSSMQDHPGHPGTDYINLLVVPCDAERILSSVEFVIELPDVQLGLIGISLVAAFT